MTAPDLDIDQKQQFQLEQSTQVDSVSADGIPGERDLQDQQAESAIKAAESGGRSDSVFRELPVFRFLSKVKPPIYRAIEVFLIILVFLTAVLAFKTRKR